MRSRVLTKLALCYLVANLGWLSASVHAQSGQWAWMGGNSILTNCPEIDYQTVCGQPGVYGTLGVPASGNTPGSRAGAATWTDRKGNLWLFGGWGFDAGGTNLVNLDDLWQFDPSINQWAWMGGSSAAGNKGGRSGVYGTLGAPAPRNIPGSRGYGVTWTDDSGNLWLFGGYGFDSNDRIGMLNDLWEFDPLTREWTWMSGSSTLGDVCGQSRYCGRPGVYGTQGSPGAANVPGSRWSPTGWTSGGDLWLFGGVGVIPNLTTQSNELWKFNVSTRQWTWMDGFPLNGKSLIEQSGVYGMLGAPASVNFPGDRDSAVGWTDDSGNLWLIGGLGWQDCEQCSPGGGYTGFLNDLWNYAPSTNQWTWMGGGSTFGPNLDPWPGVYGELGKPNSGNAPGGRENAMGWTYRDGNSWLFGGWGPDSAGHWGYLNDLWKFDPSTNEWGWMGGSDSVVFASKSGSSCITKGGLCGQPGVYGTLNYPDAQNAPGGRNEAVTWTDNNGNLWLFGGNGFDAKGKVGSLNDLWRYQFKPSAAAPTFAKPAGRYLTRQTVSISDTTKGAAIYYTVDGAPPTRNSTKYTGALSIAKTTTVNAVAIAAGHVNSAVATANYIIVEDQTIRFTTLPGSVTYGVKSVTLSAQASSKLPVTYSLISGPATLNGSKLTVTGVGKIVVAANQAGNTDYAPAPQVELTITVNRAALTVKATSLSIAQGSNIPKLTYSIAGFVDGDKQSGAVSGAPKLWTNASSKSKPGTYTIYIVQNTLEAKNYKLKCVPGVLTIR